MKPYSLRRATFLSLLVPMLLSLVLVAGSGLLSARSAIAVLRDHEMEQEAVFLQMLATHEAAEGEQLGLIRSPESYGLRELQAQGSGFRIWAGKVVMTEAGRLPKAGSLAPSAGFAEVSGPDGGWRRYVAHAVGQPLVVEIAEPMAVRDTLTWQMARSLIVPMLFLVIVVAAIATLRMTRALRPLGQLSAELDRRDSADLRPLAGLRIPAEVVPLVDAINDLMARLGYAIIREREFADNAAHELRTPLAALKTRAQATRVQLSGNAEAAQSLDLLVAAVDRMTGVIEQLLLMARLDGSADQFGPIDLTRLVTDVAREAASAAVAKHQDFAAEIADGLTVQGNGDALSIALRNLLDNAVRYTPPHGHVRISAAHHPQGVVVVVDDDGPGLHVPPEQAFARFTRFDTSSTGNGLGLSMADQITRQHNGDINLENRPEGGLRCTIRLPSKQRLSPAGSGTSETSLV
jgi:two-component system sensor histidine kinase QseC